LKDIISKEQDKAFWKLFCACMFFFGISIFAIRNNEFVFGKGEEVTAMGTSAAVMILTNLIAWPSILEGIRR
jgi:hypothetical protein